MRIIGTLVLPGSAATARTVRRYVRQAATTALGLSDSDVLDDMELCACELFANAVKHTASGKGGHVMVVVGADEKAVRITVVDDGGADTKPCVLPDTADESGRGLWLVEQTALRWGADQAKDGRTAVWADFPRPAAPPRHRAPS